MPTSSATASSATASGASRIAHQRRINATLATIATRQRLIIIAVVQQHATAVARVRVRVAVRAWRHLVKRASIQRRRRRRRMRVRGVLASRRQHVIDVQLLRRHAGTQQAVHVSHDGLALAAAHRQRLCDSRY